MPASFSDAAQPLTDGRVKPFIHRVQHRLCARFNSHPHFGAPCCLQILDSLLTHQIGARLNLERDSRISLS